MEDEQVQHEALEQVQELQHQLQEVLEGPYPPHDPETHQNWTHRDGLGAGAGVVEGVISTSRLRAGKEADVGCLDIGKYLSSKSALSEMTTFFVVGL